jgi:hypothetical protein
MKLTHMFAAVGIAVAALGASAPAQARDNWHDSRYDQRRDHDGRWDNERRWHRDDRGRNRGWYGNGRHQRHCWMEWRHHHRVRVCR